MNRFHPAVCFSALAVALTWVFWRYFYELSSRWSADPSYSHGFLVPLFSLFLLARRRQLAGASAPAMIWAMLFLVLGTLLQLVGSALMIRTLAHYSLPFFLAGVCLGLCGWRAMRWAWPSIVFLFFMVPLPGPAANLLSHPLQRVATAASTYLIQLVGIPAVAEGNVILLSDARLGVAEACSGLRMLVSFAAFAAVAALLIDRKPWEKIVILASAVPIAVMANVARIAVTAAMYEWVSPEAAEAVFHDLAGWLMMPLALLLLAGELRLLSALFLTFPEPAPLTVAAVGGRKSGPPQSSTRTAVRRKPLKAT